MIVRDDTRSRVDPTCDWSRPHEGNTPRIPSAVGAVNDHLSWELAGRQTFEELSFDWSDGQENVVICGHGDPYAVSCSNGWKQMKSYLHDFGVVVDEVVQA